MSPHPSKPDPDTTHAMTPERGSPALQDAPAEAEVTQAPATLRERAEHYMPSTQTSQVSKLFPRSPSVLSRKIVKQFETLRMNEHSDATGLANQLYALAAQPIRKGEDAQQQWKERLKALKALAKQVERGTLDTPLRGHSTVVDREAAEALDRLLTLNKGSGEKQQLHRAEQFIKAARADSSRYSDIGLLRHSISSLAERFNRDMGQRRAYLEARRPENSPEPKKERPSAEQSGIYAELAQILKHHTNPNAIVGAAGVLYTRVADDKSFNPMGSTELPRPAFLNYQVRSLIHKVLCAPLTSSQQASLLRQMVVQLRPAAEAAHSHGVFDARIAANHQHRATQPEPEHDPIAQMWARQDQLRAEAKAQRHEERAEQRGARLAKRIKLGMLGLFGLGTVGGISYVGMEQSARQRAAFAAASDDDSYRSMDINAYSKALTERFNRELDASEARLFGRREDDDMPAPTPHRDEYRAPAYIPAPARVYSSPEEKAYQECILSDADISTCPTAPDLLEMQREADGKYSPPDALPGGALPAEEMVPPPISDAPRYTAADVQRVSEALPSLRLASAADRSVAALKADNVAVNFTLKN